MAATLTGDEEGFVHSQRVARLASVDGTGNPHAVPVCYAFDGTRFYTPLDEKPKRVPDRDLRRVRNIQEAGRVALLVDRYDDDWSLLGYVLIQGLAELLPPAAKEHPIALTLLRERYLQYRTMALDQRPIIAVTPHRVVSWGHLTG